MFFLRLNSSQIKLELTSALATLNASHRCDCALYQGMLSVEIGTALSLASAGVYGLRHI
jgi:hypothetical protein